MKYLIASDLHGSSHYCAKIIDIFKKENFDLLILLGDIYICDEVCVNQANEYGHSIRRELAFLFTHGLLHLFGYDHVNSKEEEEVMFKLQDEILNEVDIKRGDINEK